MNNIYLINEILFKIIIMYIYKISVFEKINIQNTFSPQIKLKMEVQFKSLILYFDYLYFIYKEYIFKLLM